MDTTKNHGINFPAMNTIGAVTVTLMLLIIIPTLTKISITPQPIVERHPPVIFENTRPPEPLAPVDEVTSLTPIAPIKTEAVNHKPQPTEKIKPNPVIRTDTPGDIAITSFKPIKDMKVPVIKDFFSVSQVDRAPFITRLVKPIYPFSAKSSGIEGRVVLRFVVDEKGFVQDPEVVQSEPEGVFDKPALDAIVKYRFKPASIGGSPVKCIVRMPIGFSLKE